MKRILLLLAASLLGGCEVPGAMEPAKDLGGEVRANSTAAGDQQFPAIARNARGDMVVVWDSVGQDGSLSGIYGQRFRNGQPVGPEFRANTYIHNRQNLPAVAMDGAGNFVVAWRSSGQGSDGGTIFAQFFDAEGNRVGGEQQVSASDSDYDSQSEPAAAMNERGDAVIVWSDRELSEVAVSVGLNTLETRAIEARMYGPGGVAKGAPFPLVSGILAITRAPTVGIDAAGNFVAAWVSEGTPAGIRGISFMAAGVPNGIDFFISDRGGGPDFPALAMAPDGRFVVTWENTSLNLPALGVYARRFDAGARPVGDPFQVGSAVEGFNERAAAGIDDAGNFVIAAQAQGAITLARYAADGTPGARSVIAGSRYFAMFPALATDGSGATSLAWQTFGYDGDGRGINVAP